MEAASFFAFCEKDIADSLTRLCLGFCAGEGTRPNEDGFLVDCEGE
jgi:hypothetical protein